jgi:hypothetical protein
MTKEKHFAKCHLFCEIFRKISHNFVSQNFVTTLPGMREESCMPASPETIVLGTVKNSIKNLKKKVCFKKRS